MGVNQSSSKNYTNERTPLYVKVGTHTICTTDTNRKHVQCTGCNKSIRVKPVNGFVPVIERCGKVEDENNKLFSFAYSGKQHAVKLIRIPSTA